MLPWHSQVPGQRSFRFEKVKNPESYLPHAPIRIHTPRSDKRVQCYERETWAPYAYLSHKCTRGQHRFGSVERVGCKNGERRLVARRDTQPRQLSCSSLGRVGRPEGGSRARCRRRRGVEGRKAVGWLGAVRGGGAPQPGRAEPERSCWRTGVPTDNVLLSDALLTCLPTSTPAAARVARFKQMLLLRRTSLATPVLIYGSCWFEVAVSSTMRWACAVLALIIRQ